jgi:hypothetical protein
VTSFLNAFYTTVIFPFATTVSSIFWTVYSFDEDLIIQPQHHRFFTPLLIHALHTLIVIPIIFEIILIKRIYLSKEDGLFKTNFVFMHFDVCLIVYKYTCGSYQYPFLNELQFPQVIIYIIFTHLLISLWYLIGEHFSKRIWRNSENKK